MLAAEIRRRFLDYFARQQHAVRPSSSLVPGDDPTLLFTNAGMVQFKKVFLGLEDPDFAGRRATTSQKCVRAGGKHNDLEQVGHTARHHTFFEMLGNFSFGDYFKRDAIRFAWEFVTEDLKIPREHIRVSVHHTDHEARGLWREIAGLDDARIYGLGDKDNFWQMADTGPCGPCTELYVDLAHLTSDWRFPEGATGEWTDTSRAEYSEQAFVEGAEAGRFLEIWNLVFMQYDRQADGTLVPLPKPSVDTGAGLERIAAVKQGVTNNYHTDLFAPMLAKVEEVVGFEYWGRTSDEHRTGVKIRGGKPGADVVANAVDPASFRVLADHARAVAFLLADGVFPSNEGRGYVLRRILRRAVRHAWLLGRTEPTLTHVVKTVVDTMGDVFPELRQREKHVVDTTRIEEQSFLATISGGLARFEQLAPTHSTQGASDVRGTISGEDAFRLYDTFGFPIDLTELMARERGYVVDIAGFESQLDSQRKRSQEERKSRRLSVQVDELGDMAQWRSDGPADPEAVHFVGYDRIEIETQVAAVRELGDHRVAVLLAESPFYAESGGQVSDHGEIVGDGWRVDVDDVKKIDGRPAAVGTLTGRMGFGTVMARVPARRRKDTERNHTATHLLHAALREALGEAVHQAGSLVTPERLRFDFTHHGPVKADILARVEHRVNEEVWRATAVTTEEMPYPRARERGAMALFGEKYGDVVRVVNVEGYSMELCGGTHVRNTSEIGLFRIVSENGVASGVRRIEAVTGPGAFALMQDHERRLHHVAEMVKSPIENVEKRVQQLLDERKSLEKRIEESRKGGGDAMASWIREATQLDEQGTKYVGRTVTASDVKELQAMADALREQLGSGVGMLLASLEDGKNTMLVVVTDDLRARGIRADVLIKEIAAIAGGRGGGKPHLAQAGIPDAGSFDQALSEAPAIIRRQLVTA
ncbi:MAG: Alanine-tRNA ligase, eukaryota/bacteria [Gemmatimonadetes bacterium]|nr:Alanine-tRNA ligase, eukaryota/bacteria [Gemmatimonadota bacterium]